MSEEPTRQSTNARLLDAHVADVSRHRRATLGHHSGSRGYPRDLARRTAATPSQCHRGSDAWPTSAALALR
jgi:hypothetical protein